MEIMGRINTEKFRKMSQVWKKHKKGIQLSDFILLLQKFTEHANHERLDLMNGSIELFNDIDINADGRVEWHEFVQYITD
jgi:Ca2+-binding EF-hand superfamily protein